MFVEAFGLTRDPFMDTADPSFYYETIACAHGRRRLADCLIEGRGLAVVVGPIGAGKTTLCNAVQEDVLARPGVRAGLILDPSFSDERELLGQVAAAFGVEVAHDATPREMKDAVKAELFASLGRGVQHILFIDEAHTLPEPLYEPLRGLLNYQVDERKLLSLALSGQMELVEALARHPSLTDRIATWIELGPLEESEAAALLDHRLRRAGFAGARSPFEPAAASLAWRLADGLPRRLTALARESMAVAAERGGRTVATADVESATRRVAPKLRATPAVIAPAPAVPASGKARWPWSWFAS